MNSNDTGVITEYQFCGKSGKKKTTQTYEEGIFISHISQREKLGTQAA